MGSSTSCDRRGTLVLIGGALDEDPEIIDAIVDLARESRATRALGGDAAPRIAILTTASQPAASAADLADDAESDEADGQYYARIFARHGAVGVPIPVGVSPAPACAATEYSRARATDPEIADLVRSCDGVFFGGGDQSHYLLALTTDAPQRDSASTPAHPTASESLPGAARTETAVMTAIRDVLDQGGVVAGTSAGLAIQQGPGMVTGGTSRSGWQHGITAGYADDDRLRFHPAGGFGFFTEGLLDSHFTEWGRFGRAPLLGRASGRHLVFGVDEGTALIYDRAARVGDVIGAAGVHRIDLAEAQWNAHGPAVTGVRWTRCTAGDRLHFAAERIDRASSARPVHGTGAAPGPARGLWDTGSDDVLLDHAQALLDSPADTATVHTARAGQPGFRCTLAQDHRTTRTDAGGFSELRVSITPTTTYE